MERIVRIGVSEKSGTIELTTGFATISKLGFGLSWSRGLTDVPLETRFSRFTVSRRHVRDGIYSREETVLGSSGDGFSMELSIGEMPFLRRAVRLAARITNHRAESIRLWSVDLLTAKGERGSVISLEGDDEDHSFYAYNPGHMNTGIDALKTEREPLNEFLRRTWSGMKVQWHRHDDPIHDASGWHTSIDYGGFFRNGGEGLFAGFYSPGDAFGEICVRRGSNGDGFVLRSLMDGVAVESGESRSGEDAVLLSGDLDECAGTWADLTSVSMGTCRTSEPLSGFCTWYRLGPRVTEGDVMLAADEFSRLPRKIDVIQIDDGYQRAPGDWEPNERFPSGMRSLSDAVRARGFIPGLWIAPLTVHEDSALVREHPDWVQRLPDGTPSAWFSNWGGRTFYLDPSHPEAARFMHGIVRKAVHEWRYDYLKFDFTYPVVPGSVFHDRKKTSFQMMRDLYRSFRSAAGLNTFILACVGEAGRYAIGSADAGRIGPDSGRSWSRGSENAMRCAVGRGNISGRWWWNDPDIVYLRDDGVDLTFEERLFFLTVTALTGGITMTSDLPSQWSGEALDAFLRTIPPRGGRFMQADGSSGRLPRILYRHHDDWMGASAIAASLVWDDDEKEIIDLKDLGLRSDAEYHVSEYWTRTYHGVCGGRFEGPSRSTHSARIYTFTPVGDGLRVVGDSVHAADIAAAFPLPDGSLTIRWRGNMSEDFFILAGGDDPKVIEASGCEVEEVTMLLPGIHRITVKNMGGEASLKATDRLSFDPIA